MEDVTNNLSEENINSLEEETPSDTPHNNYRENIKSKNIQINQEQLDLINQPIHHNYQEEQNNGMVQKKGNPIIQEERQIYQLYQPNQIYQSYQQEQEGLADQPVHQYQMIQTNISNEIIQQPIYNYPIIQIGQNPEFQDIQNIYEHQDNNYYDQNIYYYQINQSHNILGNHLNNYNKIKIPTLRQNIHNINKNSEDSDKNKKKKRKKKNSGPKDSLSKLFIPAKEKNNSKICMTSRREKELVTNGKPKLISFQEISSKKISKSKLNMENGNFSEFVEIPRNEYQNHADKETVFLEKGMNTGKYTFRGKETTIKEDEIPGGKVKIKEEDILEELTRRTNKKNKKVKYEICDKFYSLFEFDREGRKKPENKKNGKEKEPRHRNNTDLTGNNIDPFIKNLSPTQPKREIDRNGNINSYMNIKNFNYGNNLIYNNELASMFPKDNFSKYILEKINRIRIDPQSYIRVIEDAKANIKQYRNGVSIYNGKNKIALSSGASAFNLAISILRNTENMQKLIFSPQLTVELPNNETEIKDKNDLKIKVENMVREGINVKSFWRDIIKDPETCFLLMIVDDNGINSGMKRNDILNPKMKYIGISSVEINGHFVCYLTLSTSVFIDYANRKE